MWGLALQCAVYIMNRVPTKALNPPKIPAVVWYGHKIDLSKLKVFGSIAYAHIPPEDRNGKLAARSQPLIMVGYAPNGYRLWCPQRKVVYINILYPFHLLSYIYHLIHSRIPNGFT